MKSTGEVLGLGKNMQEALFKGLVSAGYKVEKADTRRVLISVNRRDQPEIVGIARKLDEMGFKLYATDGTAQEISQPGHRRGGGGQAGPGQPGVPAAGGRQDRLCDPHRLHGAQLYPGLHPPEPPLRPAGHSLPDRAGYGRCPDGHPGQPVQPGRTRSSSISAICGPSGRSCASPRCRPAATTTSSWRTSTGRSPARSPCASPSATGTTASAPTASSSWSGPGRRMPGCGCSTPTAARRHGRQRPAVHGQVPL